jgi:hypothetical protein
MSRSPPRPPRLVSPGTPFADGLEAGYAHGYDIGFAHGYAQAENDMEAAWARVAEYVRRTANQPSWTSSNPSAASLPTAPLPSGSARHE